VSDSRNIVVALVGGVGYLGYNLLYEHSSRGHSVYVVAREKSVERRRALVREIEGNVEEIVVYNSLRDTESVDEFLSKYGCPDIMYLTLGKLIGRWDELEEANAKIPFLWGRRFVDQCKNSSLVYISSILSIGKPPNRSSEVIVEEEEHLKNYTPSGIHSKSKMLGERNIKSLCGRGAQVIIIRPGILIGRWCYHKEWRLLSKLASFHVRLVGGPNLHFVAARDIARIVLLLRSYSNVHGCVWVNAAPWRAKIGDIHRYFLEYRGIKYSVPIPLPSSIPTWIPGLPSILKEYRLLTQYRIRSAILDQLGFKWTNLEDSLKEAVEWLSSSY